MKSFTRIKKINGHEYLYEITPYYDRETKKIKQKSKYLGKFVDGVAQKVHSKPIASKRILSGGEFKPLLKITEDLKIDASLQEILDEKQVWILLTLAMNYVVRPRSLCHIESWYEGTILSEDHPSLPLSSQSLSNFLGQIGETTIPFEFSKRLISNLSTSDTLVYDITSLSSYSQMINLLEYGYNRDGLDLPQMNLSMIVDRELGIPIMYDLYPGSIADVSTLKNTIKKVRSVGVEKFTLVMDRGFFSTANLEELISNDLSFIIPPSNTVKSVKESISAIHALIDSPKNLRLYQKEPLFVMPVTIEIGKLSLAGYAYYDQNREQKERNSLYKRLYDLVERIKAANLKPWMNPETVIKEIARKDIRFLEWTVENHRFLVKLKANAISQQINRMGKFILLYRGKVEWDECLSIYRSKDVVEKGFDALKNELEAMPANVRKDATVRGYLFVCFLALLMRMRLTRMMRDTGLIKKYSIEGIITELEKIHVSIMPDGQKVLSEITKKQRNILESLGICA